MRSAKPTTPAPTADEVAAVWASMERLHPWDANPRKNADAVRGVVDSIKRFGWGNIILAREANGEMVAGHTRFAAAEELIAAWPSATAKQRAKWHPDAVRTAEHRVVPVRFGTWSEPEAHLLAIADNKLNEKAEWDNDAVAAILSNYSLGDAQATGFETVELDRMFERIRDGGPSAKDSGRSSLGSRLKYNLIVECADEQAQGELMDRLEAEGFACKPMVS